MVSDFIKVMPPWSIDICAVLIICGLGVSLWWITLGAKSLSSAMGRENKIIKLQEDISEIKVENIQFQNTAEQVTTAILNVQSFIESLNNLQFIDDPEELKDKSTDLVQRIIEALASDVKTKPGDKHRCGLWILVEEDELLLFQGSTGFPEHYINQRRLNINWSVAGKSFRKQQTFLIDDVTLSDEWLRNNDSNSTYKSIVSIPIMPWGVLTIDGHHTMNQDVKNIGELYSKVIIGALHYFFKSLNQRTTLDQYQESAATVE